MTSDYIDIVFDGPPEVKSGRFVEVEDSRGASIAVGQWIKRGDGFWALRLPTVGAQSIDLPAAQREDEHEAHTTEYAVSAVAGEEESLPLGAAMGGREDLRRNLEHHSLSAMANLALRDSHGPRLLGRYSLP